MEAKAVSLSNTFFRIFMKRINSIKNHQGCYMRYLVTYEADKHCKFFRILTAQFLTQVLKQFL